MVGTDCAVGKIYSALTLHRELERRNIKATFRATGQTGIMIAGEGIPIDSVVAEVVSVLVLPRLLWQKVQKDLTTDLTQMQTKIAPASGRCYTAAAAGCKGIPHDRGTNRQIDRAERRNRRR